MVLLQIYLLVVTRIRLSDHSEIFARDIENYRKDIFLYHTQSRFQINKNIY